MPRALFEPKMALVFVLKVLSSLTSHVLLLFVMILYTCCCNANVEGKKMCVFADWLEASKLQVARKVVNPGYTCPRTALLCHR